MVRAGKKTGPGAPAGRASAIAASSRCRCGATRHRAACAPRALRSIAAPHGRRRHRPRGIAGTCMIETAEGPVAMAETPNKGFAVMTRLPAAARLPPAHQGVTSGPGPARAHRARHRARRAHGGGTSFFYRSGMAAGGRGAAGAGRRRSRRAFQYPEGYKPPDRRAASPAGVPVRRGRAGRRGPGHGPARSVTRTRSSSPPASSAASERARRARAPA